MKIHDIESQRKCEEAKSNCSQCNGNSLLITLVIALLMIFFGIAALQRVDQNYNYFIANLLHEQEEKFSMIKRTSIDIRMLRNENIMLRKKIIRMERLCNQTKLQGTNTQESYPKPRTGQNLGYIYSSP